MSIVLAIIVLLLVLLWALGVRAPDMRAQLATFFAGRGIEIVEIRRPSHPTYGYPGYVIVFTSKDEAEAFRRSTHYSDFLQAVQCLHSSAGRRARPFDARLAVSLEP